MSIYPPLHETNPRRLRARQATNALLREHGEVPALETRTQANGAVSILPSMRNGLQANAIDTFWVEVRETIWDASQRSDREESDP